MDNDVALTSQFYDMLRGEILPELLDAGEQSLAAYEQGRNPDGTYNFTNYTLGCAFWDNFFTRLKRVCVGGNSFFNHFVYNNVLQIYAPNNGKRVDFFISRVHPVTRAPSSGKGLIRLLHSQILESQEFLSHEIRERIRSIGVYTIGVDIDKENGIGMVTFDTLVPSGKKGCHAFTHETLYNAASHGAFAVNPEYVQKTGVSRNQINSLPKVDYGDKETSAESLKRKKPKRENGNLQSAKKAQK
ncbi:MAG: hypothetical protein ACOY4F_11295 [Thermodesulfobacteriota bacterium]